MSEFVRNRLAGLRWEGAYITYRPPSWIYGEDTEVRRNRKGGKRGKGREREVELQIKMYIGKSRNRRRKNEAKRDGRREGKAQEGR